MIGWALGFVARLCRERTSSTHKEEQHLLCAHPNVVLHYLPTVRTAAHAGRISLLRLVTET